jgi:hypothetical protein
MNQIAIQLFPKGVLLWRSIKPEFSKINLIKKFTGFWGFGEIGRAHV